MKKKNMEPKKEGSNTRQQQTKVLAWQLCREPGEKPPQWGQDREIWAGSLRGEKWNE